MKRESVRTILAVSTAIGAGAIGAIAAIAACSSNSTVPTAASTSGTTSGSSGASNSGATSGSSPASGTSSGSASSGLGQLEDYDGGTPNAVRYADATVAMYDGPPPNVDGGHLLCATPNGLPIQFNPMYSGFDGMHTYQIPTFVSGVDPATVTWGSSDPTMVDMAPYVTGIMITTKKAGDVTIVANVGSMCGSATLHITQYTPDEWTLGSMRYNNGNPLKFNQPDGGFQACAKAAAAAGGYDASMFPGFDGNFPDFDGNGFPSGFDASAFFDGNFDTDSAAAAAFAACLGNPFESPPAACTNCHGTMSNGKIFGMSIFMDVSHTPEQTGGFSDDDLIGVFTRGTVPPGGYFDTSITDYTTWHGFHTWYDIDTMEEQIGMVAYLRSLPPAEQVGCSDLFKKMGPGCADAGQ